MEEKNLPNNDFVREQIKDKPKKNKGIWVRLCTSALCGAVFALAACSVVLMMKPKLQEGQETQETQPQETERETETQMAQVVEPEETEKVKPFSIGDYQQIQTQLYAIGNEANHSIVTITSVVSDTDWFNNSYEREGQGSGTIVGDRNGRLLILTEKKVIKDASEINVTFSDDTIAPAELVKYDGNTGLAVLAVDKEKLEDSTLSAIKIMRMGSSNTVHKGSVVIALGSPLGTNYSILTGNITATNNEISTADHNYSVYTTNIVANKNGSGILINTDGEMVGFVMQSYSADSASTLTAVNVSELKPVMELLFHDKAVPYLGLSVSTVTDEIADKYDIPKGVYVKEVMMDSPAMEAGLQNGDVIISVAGQEVTSANMYSEVVLELEPKETYPVVIMREGTNGYKKLTCKVEAGILQ